MPPATPVCDPLGRPIHDLRVSVTDRCNFRCPYCMPAEVFGADYPFLQDPRLMSTDELMRILRAFVALGVRKVRLTGGEPLMRPDVPELVSRLKRELAVPDVALTTNGWLLERSIPALKAAGIDRVNVSVDSLRAGTAGRLNGRGHGPERILGAIAATVAAGVAVKVNMVVIRGVNDREIVEMAGYFRERGIPLRFIEFMDAGNHNHWAPARVVSAREILARLEAAWPLEPAGPAYRGEVAARYRYRDGGGEIGLISSITEPFCRDCHRARLSADGRLFTCLFASAGWDVLGLLREGAGDERIQAFLVQVWSGRRDRYSDERAGLLARHETREKIEMSYIGG